jgi:cation-transporting ATPase E
VIVLFLVSLWVLVILARPLNEWKAVMLASMAVAFLVTLATPGLREYFELETPPLIVTLAVIGVAAIAVAVLELSWELVEWGRRRRAA